MTDQTQPCFLILNKTNLPLPRLWLVACGIDGSGDPDLRGKLFYRPFFDTPVQEPKVYKMIPIRLSLVACRLSLVACR